MDEEERNSEENYFTIESGYGANTNEPFIELKIESRNIAIQMSPGEAVEFAHCLLSAAEASITDAFMVTWLRTRIGAEDSAVVGLLREFREWRKTGEFSEKEETDE